MQDIQKKLVNEIVTNFQKTKWFFSCIKLYNFNLFTPTVLLDYNYCSKLFGKQEKKKTKKLH
jgi:hypothetical protein